MKRYFLLFAMLISSVLMTQSAWAQLSGVKTIDPAGTGTDNYTSFKQAIDALNANGVGSGGVTFTIAGGTYSETAALVINPQTAKPAAGSEVKFAVKSGATVVLNVATANNQYAISVGDDTTSTDYVTIDGSNGAGRGLTVNATAADSSKGIVVYGDYCAIKNLTLTLSTPWSPAANGIVLHQKFSADFCTVDNCDVTATYGILVGTGTGTSQVGNVISNNKVHFRTRGIQAAQSTDLQILNNEVIGDTTAYPTVAPMGINVNNTVTTTGSVVIDGNTVHDMGSNRGTTGALIVTGINAGSKGTTYSITRNKIYNFWNASTGTTPTTGTLEVMGINLASGDSLSMYDVSNNIIYGFHDNDPVALTNKFTAGIRSQSPGKSYVYSNTVFIEGTTRNHSTMAFAAGTSAYSDTFFVYNNIFNVDQTGQSTTARSYCIYKGGTFNGYLLSDYNALMNNGTGANSYIGQPSGTTFTTWKANGTPKLFHPDAHSVNKSVVFVDSTRDYHLAGASIGDADLTGIPTPWVTTDFDGDARNEKFPYMGADEAAVSLAALVVSPGTVDFGEVAKGDSVVKSVYLKSNTKNPIVLQSVNAPSGDFVWSLTTPDTVTAADSAELKITYHPLKAGVSKATISVMTDNGTGSIAVAGSVPTMNGNYTIDGTQPASATNYQTFANAIADVNKKGLTGPVTFTVAAGTYTEAAALVINPSVDKPTAENSLKFTVAKGAAVVLNVATANNQYAISVGDTSSGADYVTIDGSNGTGRGLTVNATAADSSQGIVVYGDHCSIKNLTVTVSTPWNSTARGIVLHQKFSADYCTVDNCDVTANYGIVVGTSGGNTQTGSVINANIVHCLTQGIAASQSKDITITNNEVIGNSEIYPLGTATGIIATDTMTVAGSIVIDNNKVHDLGTNSGTTNAITVTGITGGSRSGACSITRNKVYNLFNATTNTALPGTQVQGISLNNGDQKTMFDVSNNFVWGLEDNDTSKGSNWTAGIRPVTSGKIYVTHNTVFIKHTTRNHYTAAFICGGGVDTKDTNFVYNNILYVDQTGVSSSLRSYCLYKGSSYKGILVSDYNLLDNYGAAPNSHIGSPSGSTLTAWQAGGWDKHSISKPVVFADSVADLHLAGASIGDAALTGIPIQWVTNDIDGAVRSLKYPYMGADEASVALAGISLSVASVDFGATATAGDSLGATVYIKSTTKNPITVSAVSAPKSDFTVVYAVPTTVADSSALVVSFKPHAAGTYSDTLTITSDFGSVQLALAGKAKALPRPLFTDDFTASVGTALTAAGWQQSGTSATNPVTITSDNLSFGHFSASGVGNAATLGVSGQDVYTTVGPYDTGSVYLTFMANVKTVGTGDYFIALSPSSTQTNYYARLHVKASGNGYVVGISKNNEVPGGAQYGTTVLPLNATNLIVVKYTFAPTDSTNDPISVYAFTTDAPKTEPATPEIAGYTTATKNDAADLGFVTLRQGGGATTAPSLVIDGIRVGTSWAVSVPTEVKVQSTDVPRVFSLGQNYPNPFNPSTKVNFSVENDGFTTLRVFNILGQQVETLFSGMAQAGRMYSATFNASRLPSGIYFARLESGSKVSIKKMMLMK